MNFAEMIFYVFAALTILCAGSIIFIKNVLYCALCLLGSFLGIAALYVFAFADFLAIAQIMIYIGGVLLLLIFGIMLSRRLTGDKFVVAESRNMFVGIIAGVSFFGLLTYLLIKVNFSEIEWIASYQSMGPQSSIKTIGRNLMTDYVLPFEASGIILLVALIGAAFIAGKNFNMKGKDDRN
ncbi:MAG TPA: NADH-quinone oxidoreductase subunit J [Cytophagaceae bacterium]|jgi:NADH:ubiquinone oxidoreductase subunit 6 (subunit J)|nr:NADH-quinone oxidoreductase subunit J [Cytophagaceae bacterium]